MDDYFDFDEASGIQPSLGRSLASDQVDASESDLVGSFESLLWDKTASLPTDHPVHYASGVGTSMPAVPPYNLSAFDGALPVQRAKEPCELCRQMGMDCFIAQKEALSRGCTCCISLYRECSFTHKQTPGVWMATLDPVGEDVQKESGGHVGKAFMKSLLGSYIADDAHRKSGGRLSRDAVKILKAWLATHADHPYPTEQEKEDLKQLTGLKKNQITNWLANARRRGKVRSASEDSHPGAVKIPHDASTNSNWENMNPLERWKISPPENEPAEINAIAKAVSNNPYPNGRNLSSSSLSRSRQNSSHHQSSTSNDESSSMFQAPSTSSFATEQSSVSSSLLSGSAYSHGSLRDRKDRRRRRRNPMTNRATVPQKPRAARIFQCTFCTESFAAKYDWSRHEKSLHLALERWTCAPAGGTLEQNGIPHCVFCLATNPDAAHLEVHNHGACEEKTLQERTFYRKDHLRQHLRLLHGSVLQPHMEAWKSQTTSIKSSCGFCPAEFSTWNQRTDHLAAHFKNGSDMSGWTGSWGLEPHVERLVENAVPPYMIAQERASMNPFVAVQRTSSASTASQNNGQPVSQSLAENSTSESISEDQWHRDSNCWRRCEAVLSRFIQEQMKLGHTPTDAQLQSRTRLALYGDDDPWNQTPADNKQWLAFVKKQNGLDNGEGGDLEPPKQANGETCTRIEQLPMDPPFCIPGKRVRERRLKRSSGSGSTPAATGSTPQSVVAQSSLGATAVDQIDLSSLDLAMIDDSLDLSKIDLNEFASGGGVHHPPDLDILEVSDVFSGPGLEMDFSSGPLSPKFSPTMTGHASEQQQQQQQQDYSNLDLDINQLANYSQSFRH